MRGRKYFSLWWIISAVTFYGATLGVLFSSIHLYCLFVMDLLKVLC
uniref:Transmembrane protein n=1 Tax=Medicago truncatula TaxID=3880 RepID=B7FG65_MEDTR|nr:unknown [Medicago truncatula]AFK44898.1 unknown [Medicago truncatula]